MQINGRSTPRARWSALITASLLAATTALSPSVFAAPTTAPSAAALAAAPTTQPGVRDDAALTADLKRVMGELNQAFAGGAFTDPAKRAAAAPTAIPLIKQQSALYSEFAAAHHNEAAMASVQQQLSAQLYLLGDKETVDRVDAAAGSATAADSIAARSVQLQSRWIAAGRNADAQKPVADDLEKLDLAHPDSDPLTVLTYSFANSAKSDELKSHLQGVLSDTMTSPAATRLVMMMKAKADSDAKLKGLIGKPMTIAASTVDGQSFSSDAYKGKVVLVDFWATWCVPCKAGLPEVKEIYGKYHDKGLEIIGVSNDFSADALKKFTPENGMPWVQLFDPDAAGAHRWNPVTFGYGIRGIPTMFLIDKKGVLRSVTAREEMQTLIPALLAE